MSTDLGSDTKNNKALPATFEDWLKYFPEVTSPPTTTSSETPPSSTEWDDLLKRISPMLKAILQFKQGDFNAVGQALKDAQTAKGKNDPSAMTLLKACATKVVQVKQTLQREYEKVRDENATRFNNAEKLDTIKDAIVNGRSDAANKVTQLNFAGGTSVLRGLIDVIHSESRKLETEFDKLYDDAIMAEVEHERDPNKVRDEFRADLKQWDLVAAKAKLDKFKVEFKRAKRVGIQDLGEIEKRSKDASLQNAQQARNTALAVITAKRLIDEKGSLRMEGGLMSDLPFMPAQDLISLSREIAHQDPNGLPQTVHALEMLKRLQTDKDVRNSLNKIAAPPKGSTAENLIRATLGLKKDDPITAADAKRAALSALLFQTRQGEVGSCFATASAVRVQRTNPQQVLDDLEELFRTGQLKREIEHNGSKLEIKVPLNADMLRSPIEKKVSTPRNGGNLHHAPDMIASMDYLNIKPDDREKAVKDALQDVRTLEAVKAALKPLETWLLPENKIANIPGETLKLIRGNRSISIRDAINQALDNLGMTTKGISETWAATQLGHADTDAYAVAEGYTDYADLISNGGTTAPEAVATQRGFASVDAMIRDQGLSKCADFDDASRSDNYSPEQILQAMSENAGLPPDKKAAALKGMQDAFLAQQDNRLLRAWEYTLATMVEDDPTDWTAGDGMRDGIVKAVREKATELAADYISNNSITNVSTINIINEIANDIANAFSKKLSKDVKGQYDASVKNKNQAVASDGHSSSGGFCLFYKGKKIESPSSFAECVQGVLKDSLTTALSKYNANAQNLLKSFAREISTFANETTFADNCIQKNPSTDKNDLATPWTTASGGMDDILMQFHNNSPNKLAVVKGNAAGPLDTAEKLTTFLIDTMKSMKVADRLSPDKAEHATIPVAEKAHAFNLKPGSPALQAILMGDKSTADTVKEFKDREGKKNKDRRDTVLPLNNPPDGQAADLINKGSSFFGTDTAAARTVINNHFASLNLKEISIGRLHTELQAGVEAALRSLYSTMADDKILVWKKRSQKDLTAALLNDIIPKEEFEPLIDLAMDKLKVLEEVRPKIRQAMLKQLEGKSASRKDMDAMLAKLMKENGVDRREDQLAHAFDQPRGIVFADTNWGDGDHMVQFSMVVNPLTDEIELWRMNEDGTGAAPEDQDKWVKNDEWEVYTNADQIGGALGDKEWENRRADLARKLKDCVAGKYGNITLMQGALDIADERFAEGDRKAGVNALDRLDALIKQADKLKKNRESAAKKLTDLRVEVAKVKTADTDKALKFLDGLIAEVKVLRDDTLLDEFLARRKSDLALLADAKSSFGMDLDIAGELKA